MIDEKLFKMITSPLYFSNMNWQRQREILLDIIGNISEENVINYNSKLKPLLKGAYNERMSGINFNLHFIICRFFK